MADVFTQRIEPRLNARTDRGNYEVLNFGVPGYNTSQQVADFAVNGLAYDPDVVLLVVVDNDFNISNFEDAPEEGDGPGLATLRFLRDKSEEVKHAWGVVGRAFPDLWPARPLP